MSESKSRNDSNQRVVSVSKHGQATIPKEFREKLDIDAPGKVLFRETADGDVVLERVPTPDEMQGFAREHGDTDADKRATDVLREKRASDKRRRDHAVEE